MKGRRGIETLNDPLQRFAYERFGEDALTWKLSSPKEYLTRGIQSSVMFYVVSFIASFLLSFFRKGLAGVYVSDWGDCQINTLLTFLCPAQWRNLGLLALALTELSMVLHPSASPPGFASTLFPSHITWQHVSFHRQLYITSSIALNQLLPVLLPLLGLDSSNNDGRWEKESVAAILDGVQRLGELSSVAEMETTRIFRSELDVLRTGNDAVPMGEVREEIVSTLVELQLRRALSVGQQT